MESKKPIDKNDIFAVFLMGCLFVLIHVLALAITGTFEEAGMQAFEDPDDWSNIAYIFVIIILFSTIQS